MIPPSIKSFNAPCSHACYSYAYRVHPICGAKFKCINISLQWFGRLIFFVFFLCSFSLVRTIFILLFPVNFVFLSFRFGFILYCVLSTFFSLCVFACVYHLWELNARWIDCNRLLFSIRWCLRPLQLVTWSDKRAACKRTHTEKNTVFFLLSGMTAITQSLFSC